MTATLPTEATGLTDPPTPTRPQRQATWLLTPLAILAALFIGDLLIVFSDTQVRADLGNFFHSPGAFFADAWYTMRDVTVALFQGGVFDSGHASTFTQAVGPLMSSLYTATPLILAGLAVSIAFRSGLFNIGAEGQIIAGAFVSGVIGFAIDLPAVIHLPLAIIGGIAGGALWGFIAGYLKAKTGAHEVISTIMLNYVAKYGLVFLLATHAIVSPSNPQSSKPIHDNARFPRLFGPSLPVDIGILLAIAAAAVVWWLLGRTTIGFRLRAVGLNHAAARTAGMNVGRTVITAMSLAGGLAGLAGTALALGGSTSYVLTPNLSSNIGFDAISVALLGRNRPWSVVAAGILFGVLRQGGARMQAESDLQAPIDVVTVIQALIVVFIAAPALIRAVFRWKRLGGQSLQSFATAVAAAPAQLARRFPRNVTAGAAITAAGVLTLLGYLISDRAAGHTQFQFSLPDATVRIGQIGFTARPVLIVLSLIVIAAGIARWRQLAPARILVSIGLAALVIGGIIWSLAGSPVGLNVVSLLSGSLFPAAIPLLFGAMAGIVSERGGVVNIAIEGMLLIGAFLAAVVASLTGSVWTGLLAGMIGGGLLASVLAVLSIRYLVDQAIIGMVLNVFALGVTSFLFNKLIVTSPDTYNAPGYFKMINIPLLSDIPIIGPVFFSGTIFLYLAILLVIAVHLGLFRTRWGLRLRAVGEHPRAADTAGIKVRRTRFRAVVLAGIIAGIGGAFLVLGTGVPSTFQLNMSAGKGYIALAAVIFGRWRPIAAAMAALLFGFADQLQSLLSQAGSPIDSNLLLMLPYVATLFAVAGFIGRAQAPAADGVPYTVG